MLDTLVEKCRQNGISKIRGYYYPTKKTEWFCELYGTFGFAKISEDENGNTVWELPIEGYENQNRYIEVSDNE